MGYVVNFVDNQMVGAKEINSITDELGGFAGTFEEGVNYGVGDLNRISQSLITKGVSYGCGLSILDGQVMIGAGVLFMDDGKRVEIDAEGVLLPYEEGVYNYVWFHRDTILDIVSPMCTREEPAGDDIVKLGEIGEQGNVVGYSDKATMKNSYLSLNHVEEHHVYVEFKKSVEEELVLEISPEKVGCHFAIISSETKVGNSSRNNLFCGYVDLVTGKSFGVLGTTPRNTAVYDWGTVYTEESGGKLQVGIANVSDVHYEMYLRFSLESDNVLRVYRISQKTSWNDATGLAPGQNLIIKLC